jgi:hypothetical protein
MKQFAVLCYAPPLLLNQFGSDYATSSPSVSVLPSKTPSINEHQAKPQLSEDNYFPQTRFADGVAPLPPFITSNNNERPSLSALGSLLF